MARQVSFNPIGFAAIPGGGQVVVDGDICYVGHLDPPHGTSILDISDPRAPKMMAQIEVPMHTHSHKVRVRNGLMLVNSEAFPRNRVQPGFVGGLRIYDVADPAKPREIGFHRTGGGGVHRFDFDGRHAYISTDMDGYTGQITMIVDLADPTRPREVARWWLPGQWTAGGDIPDWPALSHRTHHPLRYGDRLYVSCCEGGFAILDVSDVAKPSVMARVKSHWGYMTHTVMPLVSAAAPGRDLVVAVDEGWNLLGGFWITDITERDKPKVIGEYLLPDGGGPGLWGAHQPHEAVVDDLVFIAWLSHGLRVLDIADPYKPREIGKFVPKSRSKGPLMSNDLLVDRERRRVYLIDRDFGLDILEWSV
jgi:hypothetical protein